MPIVYSPPAPAGLRPFPLGYGSYNGIGWGPGGQVQIVSHEGLDSLAGVSTNDQKRDQAHGTWSGGEWSEGRTVTVTFAVIGADNDDLRGLLAEIELAWWADGVDRPLWLFDTQRYLNARVRKRDITQLVGGRERVARIAMQWYAPWPFYMSPTVTVPISGDMTITNPGITTPVILRVVGPSTNPVWSNDTSTVFWDGSVGSGAVLELNSDLRSATLDGVPTTPVRPDSHWWSLLHGVNDVVFAGTGTASVIFDPTWP